MKNSLYPGPAQRWGIGIGGGLQHFNSFETLSKGNLKIFAYPRVTFKPDPFKWDSFDMDEFTDTGVFYLHSLKWVEPLIYEIIDGHDEAARFAFEIVSEWSSENQKNAVDWQKNEHIWGGHTVALRTTILVALSEFFSAERWLYDEISNHIESLKVDFDGYWNHGLVQSLALAGASFRIGDKKGQELALERINKCFEEMIDEEGCINEQAPEYARYIERILRTTIKFYGLNNIQGVDSLLHKKDLIREFMAHSLQPNGEFVELGDSHRRRPNLMIGTPIEYVFSNGTQGKSIPCHKVYSQGFVYGRSGFGKYRPKEFETFYSIRFGPARIIHGHNDHMSLTFWGKDRRVIVDPGHVGYTPGPDRNYVRQHENHNVLVSVGEKHDWSAYTELIESHYSKNWQSYFLRDNAYPTTPRERSVCFTDCGPFAVFDTAISETTVKHFSQRWNIAPEFQLDRVGDNVVEFSSQVDGVKLMLLNFNIETPDIFSSSSTELHRGDRIQNRGLVAQNEKLVDAQNVGFSVKASELRMLTVGFLAEPEEEIGWSFRQLNNEASVLRVHVGTSSWSFNVNLTEKKVWGRVVDPPFTWGGEGLTSTTST